MFSPYSPRFIHLSLPILSTPLKRSYAKVLPWTMMAAVQQKLHLPHEERTANEPRSRGLHPVTIHRIKQVNKDIKEYRLKIADEKRGIKVSIVRT